MNHEHSVQFDRSRAYAGFPKPNEAGTAVLDTPVAEAAIGRPRNAQSRLGEYSLATGAAAVRRLHRLHAVYSPVGRRALLRAGLREGMRVADFGCGVGVVTRMMADIVGPSGSVTGIDVNGAQLKEAADLCAREGFRNTFFTERSAYDTGLPRNSFDLVYCRFLLLHLSDPAAGLREMLNVVKPGGILVVEDGDLTSAGSIPTTALDAFAGLFGRLGPIRGLNYRLGNDLADLVRAAGFCDIHVETHQPASAGEDIGLLLKWSVEEAATAFIDAGLVTPIQLKQALSEMQEAIDDPNVIALAPRMSVVSARKPA
jgi:SAM-dependent methyltransferase